MGRAVGVDKDTRTDRLKGNDMAAEGETRGDMQAHEKSYGRFAAMMKWGTIVSVLITFGVILLIKSCAG